MHHTQLKCQFYLFHKSLHFQINLWADRGPTPTEHQQHVATTALLCCASCFKTTLSAWFCEETKTCPGETRIYKCNFWDPQLHQNLNWGEKRLSDCHLWQNKTRLQPDRVKYINIFIVVAHKAFRSFKKNNYSLLFKKKKISKKKKTENKPWKGYHMYT